VRSLGVASETRGEVPPAPGGWAIRNCDEEAGNRSARCRRKTGRSNLDWFKWLLEFLGKGRKGTSTLAKWTCPGCGLKVRIVIKGDPEIIHQSCSDKKGQIVFFVRGDSIEQTIYQTPQTAPYEPGELTRS
jgi:hypothetical protein